MQIRVITSLLSAFGIIFGEIFLFTTRGKECNVRRVRRNATLPVSGKHGWLVGTVLPSGWKREDLHLLAICNVIMPTLQFLLYAIDKGNILSGMELTSTHSQTAGMPDAQICIRHLSLCQPFLKCIYLLFLLN